MGGHGCRVFVCVSPRGVLFVPPPSLDALEMLVKQKIIGPALCGIEGWSYSAEDEPIRVCVYVIVYSRVCGDS